MRASNRLRLTPTCAAKQNKQGEVPAVRQSFGGRLFDLVLYAAKQANENASKYKRLPRSESREGAIFLGGFDVLVYE